MRLVANGTEQHKKAEISGPTLGCWVPVLSPVVQVLVLVSSRCPILPFLKASNDSKWTVQVGLASDRDQYIHRVGRTARAGKTGQAALLLTDFEEAFVSKLQGNHLFPCFDLFNR